MKTKFIQTVTQKTCFSLRMQQSLQVLQMPIEELSLWLEEKAIQNPLIELPSRFEALPSEVEAPFVPSCFSHLMGQANLHFRTDKEKKLAEWIIGNLDEKGFYTLSEGELPSPFTKEELDFCLQEIQQFEPIGMGSFDLQECLLLQLKAEKKENTLAYALVASDLDLLIEGSLSSLEKTLRVSRKEIEKAKEELAKLDPFPGYRFLPKTPAPLTCDITLEEDLQMHVHTLAFPKATTLPLMEELTKEEKRQVKHFTSEANWVVNTLQRRSETLEKITKYLVEKQKPFLEGKTNTLAPLTVAKISEDLDLHESTITRAIANKRLNYPLGTLLLKNLLSKGLSDEVSSDHALKLLQKLIAEEDKKAPLSDRELLEKMKEHGVPCARRTITKYRQILLIPTKYKRKKVL